MPGGRPDRPGNAFEGNQDMIHLDARLRTALEISPVCRTAADIACDHGKLGAALLLEDRAQFLIDTDISERSLKKAQVLTRALFLSERTTFRVGDGLSVLDEGEAQNIYLLGHSKIIFK